MFLAGSTGRFATLTNSEDDKKDVFLIHRTEGPDRSRQPITSCLHYKGISGNFRVIVDSLFLAQKRRGRVSNTQEQSDQKVK